MLKKKKMMYKGFCSSVGSPHFRPLLLRNLSVPSLSIMVTADWELLGKFSTQNMQPRRGHVFGDCVGLTRGAEVYRNLFLPKKERKDVGGESCGLEELAMRGQGCHRWLLGARVPSRNWDLSWLQSGGEPGTLCWAESLNGIKWLTLTLEHISCVRNSHLRLNPYNHKSHTTI